MIFKILVVVKKRFIVFLKSCYTFGFKFWDRFNWFCLVRGPRAKIVATSIHFEFFEKTPENWVCFSGSLLRKEEDKASFFEDSDNNIAGSEQKKTFCEIVKKELDNVLKEIKDTKESLRKKTFWDVFFLICFIIIIAATLPSGETAENINFFDVFTGLGFWIFSIRLLLRKLKLNFDSRRLWSLHKEASRLEDLIRRLGCNEKS